MTVDVPAEASAAVGAARHPRRDRAQVRLRRRRVPGVHQPPRRRGLPAVHHAGRRLCRPHRHHHRRAGRRRDPPPGPAGVDRRGRRPVRLLPARPDHGGRRPPGREPEPVRRRHRRASRTSVAAGRTCASDARSIARQVADAPDLADGEIHAWLHRTGAGRARPPPAAGPVRRRDRLAGAHRRGHPRPRPRDLDVHGRRSGRTDRPPGRGTRSTRCPTSTYEGDIHCVTTWSKLGMSFTGVSVDTLLGRGRAAARRRRTCMAESPHRVHDQPAARRRHRRQGVGGVGGRRRAAPPSTTAVRPGCSCRTSTSGRAPSGCRASACSTTTSPGFWERNGYHDRGDPWLEQRYQGD